MSNNFVCTHCAKLFRRSGVCCFSPRTEITHEECRYLGKEAGRAKRLLKLRIPSNRVLVRTTWGRPVNGSIVPRL